MSSYKSRTTAMKHQIEAQRRLTLRPKKPADSDVMAWLMEMGTGKSKVVLDEWQARVDAKDLTDLLVVAPAGSYKNWFEDKSDIQQSEMRTHLDPELYRKTLIAPWISGGGKSTREQISRVLSAPPGRPRAMFVNVEALSTVDRAREAMREFLSRGRTLFAVDESTTIKGDSERAKAVLELAPFAPARRILTGLVTPKSPMDLFRQFEFLDWRILGFNSWYGFRARYAVTKKTDFGGTLRRPITIIVGFRNIDELQQKIKPYSYRVLKSDCLDLDPKTYMKRDVELTDEQRRMYKELRENATTELDGAHVTVNSVITRLIRLHQIVCGHVMDEDGSIRDVKSNRIKTVLEILDETEGKVVIWVTYRHELEKLVQAIAKHYKDPRVVAQFHGGNKSTRGEDERRFLGDPRCRFMCATQAAGGRGNNWTVASTTVYAANSHDLEMRMQSEDRTHRKGQKNPVTYIDVMCGGTVEEKIVQALRSKIDMATAITGENYREWLI